LKIREIEEYIPVAEWLGLEVSLLRVMGSHPMQWTSIYALVGGRW
jgi:hypothetical protein